VDCTVVNRYRMKPGDTLMGPAIIEEREATTVLLPGDVVAVSPRGHLVIAIKGAEAP
jgi:N-methylhydantoinase A/oxoprolinase/acetone carboxylase beta subunit